MDTQYCLFSYVFCYLIELNYVRNVHTLSWVPVRCRKTLQRFIYATAYEMVLNSGHCSPYYKKFKAITYFTYNYRADQKLKHL